MAIKYYSAKNTGKGFITHEDNEKSHVSGWPGEVWVTENTDWAFRVGAAEKTKSEAQALVDAAISGSTITNEAGDEVQVTMPLP
tara:strand:+ start:1136 stop:1387 length:252 start_codon:yes stop_codon:yes gene_type:complete